MLGAVQRLGLCGQGPEGDERLLHLEPFARLLGVALVDDRQRGGEVAPVERLHDRRRARPAVARNQAFHRLERSQMLLGVEAIATRAPWRLGNQAIRLVIADLLDTDASGQGEIASPQRGTNSHVKLPSVIRDFPTGRPSFYHIEQVR